MKIAGLIKEYEENKCVRGRASAPTAKEVNRVLALIKAERIAEDHMLEEESSGSNLFELVFYMVLKLANRIDKLENTNRTKNNIIKWICKNVDETVVPADEGNGDALIYNLVHLVYGDGKRYDYKIEQDKEIALLLKGI